MSFRLENTKMQTDVVVFQKAPCGSETKVFIPEMLAEIFPNLTVSVPKKQNQDFDVRYNINFPNINGEELVKLATLYQQTNVDIILYRYGKFVAITIAPKNLEKLPL